MSTATAPVTADLMLTVMKSIGYSYLYWCSSRPLHQLPPYTLNSML